MNLKLNKKGMEQSLWIIVAAVLFLVILAVVLYILLKGFGPVSAVQTCDGKGGTCAAGISGCDKDKSPVGVCSQSDSTYKNCKSALSCVCCVPTNK